MNLVAAIALGLGLPLVDQCGCGATVDPLHAVRWAVGQLSVCDIIDNVSAAATTAGDHVMCAGKGSKGKKQKAVNPWPMSGNINEPLVEIILGCIGVVVCIILAIVSYRNGL